jgi:hypothetical protein
MAVAVEKQEKGVAAELEEVAAVDGGRFQQLTEAAAEDEADLFGANFAAGGQALRKGREAGDVDKHERARDTAVGRATWVLPGSEDARDVRSEAPR